MLRSLVGSEMCIRDRVRQLVDWGIQKRARFRQEQCKEWQGRYRRKRHVLIHGPTCCTLTLPLDGPEGDTTKRIGVLVAISGSHNGVSSVDFGRTLCDIDVSVSAYTMTGRHSSDRKQPTVHVDGKTCRGEAPAYLNFTSTNQKGMGLRWKMTYHHYA